MMRLKFTWKNHMHRKIFLRVKRRSRVTSIMIPLLSVPALRRRLVLGFQIFCALAAVAFAGADEKKNYALPAGTAEKSLKQFVTQSGIEVIYPAEVVRGVRTPEVKGQMTPAEAVERLLAGTGLASTQDPRTGAFSISRRHDPNGSRAAQKTPSDRPANPSNPKPPENPQKP